MSEMETSETSCDSNESKEIIPGYTSVEQFTKDGFKILMEAIRHSNSLPTGRDWNFYTLSDSFKKIINDEGSNVLRLMNQIMRCNEIESNIRNRILDEKTELVCEANDTILEKVANNIDEMNGIRRSVPEPVIIQTVSAELPINGSWNRTSAATIIVNPTSSTTQGDNCIKLITAKNIIRPQKFFKDKINNRNNYPWCPRITDKPNSLKPLAIFLEESANGEEYSHPYEFELDRFAPTAEQLREEVPKFPKPLSETPLVEINEPDQLDDLVETLRSCKEFAVDVEHHSYRSFMGFSCLLQISTNEKDYLIDALALRDKLSVLNEVFTNNKIVKIFHGADKDIEWLQRDLAIYVVNMFDTHQAAKVLQYSGLSLAFLMKKFCNILPNKQFQLADWRMRPLPEELKTYAREDTHYLIYIYKMLKKELLLKGNKADNYLKSAIERSTELCKKRYLKPILRDDSYLEIYRKCKKLFDNRQMYALKEIYAWRDNLAREEDESLAYVLPNHMLLQISETLPREMQGILACCNPIPPLVRSHLLELHQIILKARDQPLEQAILKESTTGRGVLKKVSKVNIDSPLHCPHDLSKTNEFRDDLPTLLNSNDSKVENRKFAYLKLPSEKCCSYSVFEADGCDKDFNEGQTFKKFSGFTYFSPYERYKLVKPFIAEKEKVAEEQKNEEEAKEQEKVQEETNDDRSNEDRIASIKDHFFQLSKKFSEELEAKKEQEEAEKLKAEQQERQEVSRKRKRHFDEEDKSESLMDAPGNNLHQNQNKFNNNIRTRARKRKFNEISSGEQERSQQEIQVDKKQKHRRQKQLHKMRQENQWQRKKNKNQYNEQQQPEVPRLTRRQKQQLRKEKREQWLQSQPKQEKQEYEQRPKQERQQPKQENQQRQRRQNRHDQQQFQSYQQQSQNQRAGGQQTNYQQNRNKQFRNKEQQQTDSNFVPYDYSSVDFRQFQGGAGSATGAINIKPKFKGKNKKKMGNKGTKSAFFNMNNDRGRGRGAQGR